MTNGINQMLSIRIRGYLDPSVMMCTIQATDRKKTAHRVHARCAVAFFVSLRWG